MGMFRSPPLYALKAFESASRHQSFTQAANELSITQSAISKHVHTLEDFFDRRLFTRNGPRIVLTQEGECFSKEIQMAFHALNIACEKFCCENSKLRIKVPITFSLRWFIAIISKFYSEKDHADIKLDSNGYNFEFVDFKENNYDCAIQFGNGDFPDSWRVTRLLDEWLIPVCSPGFLSENKYVINANITVFLTKSKRDNWSFWCANTHEKMIGNISNTHELNAMDAVISAAVQGLGIALVDINMIKKEIENNTLIFIAKTAVRTGNGYYFVWPKKNAANKNISKLNDYLGEHIAEQKVKNIMYVE